MPLPYAIIVPHPPLIIPDAGRGEERTGAWRGDMSAYRAPRARVEAGFRRARANRGSAVVPLNYGLLTSLALDPIYVFFPLPTHGGKQTQAPPPRVGEPELSPVKTGKNR